MYINMYGSDAYGYDAAMLAEWSPASKAMPVFGAIFFVSFVLMGTMIILNLFIGVIMNGMEAAQQERERIDRDERIEESGKDEPTIGEEIGDLVREMDALQRRLTAIQRRASDGAA